MNQPRYQVNDPGRRGVKAPFGQEQALMLASIQYPASARPAFGRSSMPAASRPKVERRLPRM